jgi:hypothetical protein
VNVPEGSDRPPFLVRLSLRMHTPISDEWRPWALSEIERRYGPNPSDDDRDIAVPAFIDPFRPWADPYTSSGGRIPRSPLSVRKASDEIAVGLRPDGTHPVRGSSLTDYSAFLERLPERWWPWIPVALIGACALLVIASVVLAIAVS